ncbi:MAG TPA: GNAT family N-acetyltransferase [Burkholderiales bacterium]|nr:GNAT family N-acetyltransferase [Burkholderiales bacterium]
MNEAIPIRILPWPEAHASAMSVREAVFVVEQGVPAEIELDEWDPASEHALAFGPGGRAIGTGRLLPDGHIGRMAVLSDWRGRGVGSAILAALVDRAAARGMRRLVLNAQTHAVPFYARHGFAAFGDEFMEADIPHVAMAREL